MTQRDSRIKKGLKRDEKGIIELPMKLFIMMILMTVSLSFGVYGYSTVSQERFADSTEKQVDHLISVGQMLSTEGNRSSKKVELDLSGDRFAGIRWMDIGGGLGEGSWVVSYRFDWRENSEYRTAEDPMIHFTSPDNKTLSLSDKKYELTLVHVLTEDDDHIIIYK